MVSLETVALQRQPYLGLSAYAGGWDNRPYRASSFNLPRGGLRRGRPTGVEVWIFSEVVAAVLLRSFELRRN